MSEQTKDLKGKLQQHLAETGSLTEGDVAAFTSGTPGETTAEPGTAMGEDTQIPAVDPGEDDAINRLAGESNEQDVLQGAIGDMGGLGTPLAQAKRDVTITKDDKEAFVSAIVNGDRLRLRFPLCGGSLVVVVRNRTLPETQAIIAELRHEMDTESIVTNLDYSVRLRAMLMAAQIEDVHGIVRDTIDSKPPLRRTQDGEKTVEPGWLSAIVEWAALNEGMHAMLWNCVWEFETKYWAMVEDAKNQDFWLPEASSSE